MSPTVLRYKNYRFFFFSREEPRIHIHVNSPHGEAKFWVDPKVTLASSEGYSKKQLLELQKVVKDNQDEIKKIWKKYFKS